MAVALIVTAAMLLGFALSAIALRRTEPATSEPPSSAPLVDVHRRKVYRLACRIAAVLALIAACDLFLPYRPAGSLMAGMLALCAVPFLYGLHHKAVRDDRAVASLMAKPWVSWKFTRTEWQAAAILEFPEPTAPAFTWRKKWPVGLAVVAAGAAWAGILGARPKWILAWSVCLAVFPYACNWLFRYDTRAQRRRMLAAAPIARLGPDGFLLGDRFTPWTCPDFHLVRATIAAPARLMFHYLRGPYAAHRAQPYFDRPVPVPAGAGSDLQLIGQNLRHACPKAQITLGSEQLPSANV